MAEFFEFFADLHGQFACGHEHERAGRRAFTAVFDLFDDRNGERGRFAGAGAGLAQHIGPGECVGNDSGLNRRGFEIAGPFERSQHRIGKTQTAKIGR